MEEINTTIDNGVIENVHIAPIGRFTGSDAKGNPVDEDMSAEALSALADNLNSTNTEVLADIDHAASKPGVEKDTAAAGWFREFVVDPIKGMFAKLFLTKKGKELIENREYRYTSPSFVLDEAGKPVSMPTVSLTNMPAFKGFINPILNTEATPMEETEKKEVVEEVKEEVVEAVKDAENKESEATETKEEIKEEVKEEKTEEAKPITKEDIVAIVKEVLNEVKNAEPEKKEACNACDEKEVISKEALNSASDTKSVALTAVEQSEWKNLHGKEFFDYLKKNGIR